MQTSSRFVPSIFLAAVVLACPASTRRACADEPFEFQTDVEYGQAGGAALLLNLAKPRETAGPRPAVVVIHGGGWSGGKKESHDTQAKELAARGYVAATIGYRLAPKYPFPAQIEDCKCAVRWLRAHAGELAIDRQRLGSLGFSAGAHLAMLLGVMDAADGCEGGGGWAEQSSKVQAAVSFAGPTDLEAEFPAMSVEILKRFVGGPLADKRELLRQASPVTYVNSGDAAMLLFQGTNDVLVPYDQAFRLATALTKAGVPGRVELLVGAGHGWGAEETDRTMHAAYDFLDEQLRPAKP